MLRSFMAGFRLIEVVFITGWTVYTILLTAFSFMKCNVRNVTSGTLPPLSDEEMFHNMLMSF